MFIAKWIWNRFCPVLILDSESVNGEGSIWLRSYLIINLKLMINFFAKPDLDHKILNS